MFVQFKNYMQKALPATGLCAGIGAITGGIAGVTVLSVAIFENTAVQECIQKDLEDLKAKLYVEAIGALTGFATGALIGATLPGSQILFSWCARRINRVRDEFEMANQIGQDLEAGGFVRH